MKRAELNSQLKTVPIYIKILNRTFIMNPASIQHVNLLSFDEFVDMIKTQDPYIKVINFLFFCSDFTAHLNKQYGTSVGIAEIDEQTLCKGTHIITLEDYGIMFKTPFYRNPEKEFED